MTDVTRRTALKLGALKLATAGLWTAAGGFALQALRPAAADENAELIAISQLKPGDYVWYPDRAPTGFVAVVVNLSDQRAFVYRNGIRIGATTVSTGKEGHDTPTGVFTILGKDVDHHSSIYNNASMPYSERLTWSGVALHAGGLPGYPSSHGCVHLPIAFAKLLFAVTHVGTPVIIADDHTAPEDVLDPGLIMSENVEQQLAVAATGAGSPQPDAAVPAPQTQAMDDAISMVASGIDRTITVLKGAQVVVKGPIIVRDPGTPLGNVVYVLAEKGDVLHWKAISFETRNVGAGAVQDSLARVVVDPSINTQIAKLLKPGATLFITDLSAHPGTRNDGGFVVLTHKADV